MIDLDNYEEFFFRAAEGDLSSSEKVEMDQFLIEHPELIAELDAFRSTVLSPDSSLEFPFKKRLLKAEADYGNLFIQYIENDLSIDEQKKVELLAASDIELEKQFNFYKQTILKADEHIVYPSKDSLKKNPGKTIPLYIRYMSVAAVAAGLFLIAYLQGLNFFSTNSTISTAQSEVHTENVMEKNKVSENNVSVNATQLQSENSLKEKLNNNPVNKTAKSVITKSSKLIASSTSNNFNSDQSISVADISTTDMDFLKSNSMPKINFVPKERKAHYRYANNLSRSADENPLANSNEFKSMASVVGKEVLRLSGRGDYLNSANSFNSSGEKSPLNFSINSDKFKFYHKFFKNRNNSNN